MTKEIHTIVNVEVGHDERTRIRYTEGLSRRVDDLDVLKSAGDLDPALRLLVINVLR